MIIKAQENGRCTPPKIPKVQWLRPKLITKSLAHQAGAGSYPICSHATSHHLCSHWGGGQRRGGQPPSHHCIEPSWPHRSGEIWGLTSNAVDPSAASSTRHLAAPQLHPFRPSHLEIQGSRIAQEPSTLPGH